MKLRHSVACCMLALGTLTAFQTIAADAVSNQGYYRAPALHDQTLVFTCRRGFMDSDLRSKSGDSLNEFTCGRARGDYFGRR